MEEDNRLISFYTAVAAAALHCFALRNASASGGRAVTLLSAAALCCRVHTEIELACRNLPAAAVAEATNKPEPICFTSTTSGAHVIVNHV